MSAQYTQYTHIADHFKLQGSCILVMQFSCKSKTENIYIMYHFYFTVLDAWSLHMVNCTKQQKLDADNVDDDDMKSHDTLHLQWSFV